jgi:hypothetical protein
MKRYGDNVTPEDLLAERSEERQQDRVTVMFGGCGYGAGMFNKPPVKKHLHLDFKSLFGLMRKKSEEKR